MSNNYRYSKLHRDREIANIQIESQDNFATKLSLSEKYDKVVNIVTTEPKLADLANGETKVYNDGTNVWRYYRVGNRLFKMQLTEV